VVTVAGHITVEPQQCERYLAGCARIVEQALGQLAASTPRSARTWSTLGKDQARSDLRP
jgi:hypothetical protein